MTPTSRRCDKIGLPVEGLIVSFIMSFYDRNFVKFEKNGLIKLIYANIQNMLCNFVAQIIQTKFHQSGT